MSSVSSPMLLLFLKSFLSSMKSCSSRCLILVVSARKMFSADRSVSLISPSIRKGVKSTELLNFTLLSDVAVSEAKVAGSSVSIMSSNLGVSLSLDDLWRCLVSISIGESR